MEVAAMAINREIVHLSDDIFIQNRFAGVETCISQYRTALE